MTESVLDRCGGPLECSRPNSHQGDCEPSPAGLLLSELIGALGLLTGERHEVIAEVKRLAREDRDRRQPTFTTHVMADGSRITRQNLVPEPAREAPIPDEMLCLILPAPAPLPLPDSEHAARVEQTQHAYRAAIQAAKASGLELYIDGMGACESDLFPGRVSLVRTRTWIVQ